MGSMDREVAGLRGRKAMIRAQRYADGWREAEDAARREREADPMSSPIDRIETTLACIMLDINRRAARQEDNTEAINLLAHQIGNLTHEVRGLSQQMTIMMAMVERVTPNVVFKATPMRFDDGQSVSYEEMFQAYAAHAQTETQPQPSATVIKTPVTKTGKRPGPKPKKYREAVLLLESNITEGGRIRRWTPELVAALITKFSYENPDHPLTVNKINKTECWSAYMFIQRTDDLKGKWGELVRKYKI